MVADFPSINSLLKKPAASQKPAGEPVSNTSKKTPPPKPASSWETATGKFDEKMAAITVGEKEISTAQKAAKLGIPHIDLGRFPISSEALRAVPEVDAKKLGMVCFYATPEELRVGVLEPTDAIKEYVYQMGERHHASTGMYLISEHSFDHVIKLYSTLPIVKPITKDIEITDEEINRFNLNVDNLQSLEKAFKNVSMTDIVTLMVASALKVNSSDIHVEAEENKIAIRYRIDGVLHEVAAIDIDQWKRFISRIKLLSALKINVTDRPQDGRVTLKLSSGSLDIRVSTMPTIHGESVVMRILHSGNKGVTFDDLGIRGKAYADLKREIERPNGMIITTGPTGSGKTTSLYAILRTLNQPGVKVITLEDPIEIKMDGINQSQVDTSHDYTFAKGLRSILRQDPDICMVGEIRDLETAEISIQAALTGHLMLSTIHTNSAAGAIPRFLSLGVKPFLLAPALNSIIGQRLVRRICSSCVEEFELPSDMLERVGKVLQSLPPEEKSKLDMGNLKFYHGKGCGACSGLGYRGRIGVYEIFTINKEIEEIILSNKVSEYAIQEIAIKNGMVTMVQDGLLKALDKITTIEEVFRVSE